MWGTLSEYQGAWKFNLVWPEVVLCGCELWHASKSQTKNIVSFHASQPTITCLEETETPWSDLIAFFLNTLPPRRDRRPGRFHQSKYFCSRSCPFYRSNCLFSRPSWMRSQALQQSRHCPGEVVFGCKHEGHCLPECSQRNRYRRWVQWFWDITGAAAYFLAHDNPEVDYSSQEVLVHFADAEEKLFYVNVQHDEADYALGAWIADMFAVFDNASSPSPASPLSNIVDQKSYGFIPLSIPKLKGILDMTALFSNPSADQHVLLDTGAPRSICSKGRLQKANWRPLKRIELRTNTPPFSFAGHAVYVLCGALLTAKIVNFEGKDHILEMFAYVLHSTPIFFSRGLTDQSRLGSDICLRERHSSPLRISARHNIFPMTVTWHLWLRFLPMHNCSAASLSLNKITSISTLETPAAMSQAVTDTMTWVFVLDSHVFLESGNATHLILL